MCRKKMVPVDGWMIPADQAEKYIQNRERMANVVVEIFCDYCPRVLRQWAGSEDGEAVTGLNANGDLYMLVHLDPNSMAILEEEEHAGKLRAYLLSYNELPVNLPVLKTRGVFEK